MSNANASIARPVAVAKPGAKLLNPHDHTLIMIDFQSQMAFATHSIDPVQLRSNAALVASAAAGFGASTILTTVAEKKKLLRSHVRGSHRAFPRPGPAGPHLDEHLGRQCRH